ncbi:hypothetical protein TRIUR3_05941 [Triticum urartu]|uniref:X8 domain-containing protein n=2 Tax=Triticum TaxID=4564 RepID=A0A9R0UYC8_TRITD|nr:hypothetical protein TRIUR3_05941 [Triticum urartu]VAH09230.1 unnamed protein product [Triticum turgidum subsp. durum]
MAVPLVLVLLVAMFTGSDAMYCVCKSDANPAAMQKAIDYACGKGADCTQITSSGPCFQPSSVVAHCSYACNSYYQKNAGMGATCDFMGVATLVAADPSAGSCKYPASARLIAPPIYALPPTCLLGLEHAYHSTRSMKLFNNRFTGISLLILLIGLDYLNLASI